MSNYRVDVSDTSLQIMCKHLYQAKRAAKTHSQALKTWATVIQLHPEYAVLDSYHNGELTEIPDINEGTERDGPGN